jgi:hypothetical protein
MKSDNIPDTGFFTLPEQTIRGSRQAMLASIDQAIVGLLALRHLVAGEALVMPGADEARAGASARKRVPASMAQVGAFFSNLMRGQD